MKFYKISYHSISLSGMSELIYRFRDIFTMIVCVIVSVFLLNTNDNPQMKLLRLKTSVVTGFLARPFMFFPHTIRLFSVNRDLNRRLLELEEENANLKEMQAENKRLREALNFVESTDLHYLPAIVIGKSSSGSLNSITIDRGEAEGVQVGMPVVSSVGLAGQVVAVDKGSALCQLLLDNKFGAAVKVQRNRIDGIIHWESGDVCRLDGIPATMDVRVGDELITSGLDGVYNKGLKVGKVIKVKKQPDKLFQRILVEPFTDFHRLEEVFVLVPEVVVNP